jgi:hypoxanthine phosphoribosyltransferase
MLKEHLIPYITVDEIDEMVTQLAKEIEQVYFGKELVLICPLKGSSLFTADIMRKINLPQKIDFVQLTSASLEGEPKDGTIKMIKDISTNITGKHVLIVEEIIDEGRTLSFLKNRLLSSGPASLRVVTLLDKPARRVINIKPDFVGRTIEDRFVIGYGMDDGEVGRNYKEIYYLKH